jgi:hypothetical protein
MMAILRDVFTRVLQTTDYRCEAKKDWLVKEALSQRSTFNFSVYFYEAVAQTSQKYQPGNFGEYSKEYRKNPLAI